MDTKPFLDALLGLALRLLDWIGGVGLGLFDWVLFHYENVWDWGVATWAPPNMLAVLSGQTGHSLARSLLFVAMAAVAINYLKAKQRHQRELKEARKEKISPLSDRRPFRLPYFDRLTRPLRVSRKVTVDLKDEHGASIGMTASGKSSVMSQFVTGLESTFGLMFDVSMPTIAAARRLQRKIAKGKLYKKGTERWKYWWWPWIKTGLSIYPPVYVWRPRDKSVVLLLLEGIPEDVLDSIRDAFSKSSGDTGHQWGIVFKAGVLILRAIDAKPRVRTLTSLSGSLEAIATQNKKYLEDLFGVGLIPEGFIPADLQTKNACWSWATKLSSLKAMFGEAEGEGGLVPAAVLDAGGTLLCEFNTFASKATAEAISGFALRILASALNYCHVPVMVLMDESGQMKGRAIDIASIFRAARARGGRCWLCTQDPTDLLSAMATNIGIWVIFGAGAGAIEVLKWCASITHGRREPGDYIMTRRTWGLILKGCLGLRKIRIHRECDVIYEGSIIFTTVDAPNARTLKRDLHYRDWPNNRGGEINDHGLTQATPEPPLPVGTPLPTNPVSVPTPSNTPARSTSSTTKMKNPVVPTHQVVMNHPSRPGPAQTVTFGTWDISLLREGEGIDEGTVGRVGERARVTTETLRVAEGPSPWEWINCDSRRVAIWETLGKPVRKDECWLAPVKMVNSEGRASISYCGDKVTYVHVYEWAGQPNGERFKGCYMDHTCHNNDKTCRGGKGHCDHVRCMNPFTLEPVTPSVSAQRRQAHALAYREWAAENDVQEAEEQTEELVAQ